MVHKLDAVVHACPLTREAEARGTQDQGQTQQLRPCLKYFVKGMVVAGNVAQG